MNYIVEVNHVCHCYPDNTQVEIGGIEFKIAPSEKVVLLGSNGSGKSTLLNHLTGLLGNKSGDIKVFGYNPKTGIKKIRHRLGIVMQAPEEQLIGPTVWDDIAFAPRNAGWLEEEVKVKVSEVMEELGLSHLANKIPHYLSGGEQQKVALAGSLVMRPELLILDEPFSRLDLKSRKNLIKTLDIVNQKYKTAILCTLHDINYLPELADTVYLMKEGKFIAKGKPEQIITNLKLLKEAGLETPTLLELINVLRLKGLAIPYTLDLHELADFLVDTNTSLELRAK